MMCLKTLNRERINFVKYFWGKNTYLALLFDLEPNCKDEKLEDL